MNSVRIFWRWWCDELSSLTPGFIKVAFFGGSSARSARFAPGIAEVKRRRGCIEIPETLLGPTPPVIPKLKRPQRVDVVLPEQRVLKRQISAPKKARGKLADLARLDLKRNTPIPEDAASWALGGLKTEGQNLNATQYVAKKADMGVLRRSLSEVGLEVRRFVVSTPEGKLLPLAGDTSSASGGRGWRRLNAALAFGVVCASTFVWLQPAIIAQARIAEQETKLRDLRRETVALRRELDAARAQFSEDERLKAALRLRPRLVESLRNVTVSLPDEAWLADMTFSPEAMTLSGETSGAASDLVLGLSENRQFGNPRLSGPTTRTNTGRERFEIAAKPGGAR